MRSSVRVAAVVAASLALGGVALPGSADPVTVPATCGPDECLVDSNIYGYSPAVATIDSGTVVRWASSDAPHPTGEAFPPEEACFTVPVGPGVEPVEVRFDVVAGTEVRATTGPGPTGEVTATCESAEEAVDGQHVLEYRCMLHPWMFGTLVIEEPAG